MTEATSAPSPFILLFARGVLALLDLWPALIIAVAEEWGGPESREKKTWLASTIIDEFESRANLPSDPSAPIPANINDQQLDHDDLADLLNQIMSDEFEANIEDGSIDVVSTDILRLWRDILDSPAGTTAESLVEALEKKSAEVRKAGVKATKGPDPIEVEVEDGDDESSNESDEEMTGDEAPQLVPREKERQEPIVDDDGFTLVQKGSKRSGR
jgi:pre-rRNA-processing protein TSR2